MMCTHAMQAYISACMNTYTCITHKHTTSYISTKTSPILSGDIHATILSKYKALIDKHIMT